MMLLPVAAEELLQEPAADADCMPRQSSFLNRIIRKFLDHICVRAVRGFRPAQTTKESQPLLGVRDEAYSSVSVICHVVRSGLTANPSIGCYIDLLKVNFIGRFQMQVVDEHQ